jgi:GPH family glycoside/pentoside/hexuronide:cation symporter
LTRLSLTAFHPLSHFVAFSLPSPVPAAVPLKVRLAYASGMAGWSILVNIIGVMLPYFYLKPGTLGLIPQLALLGVFNLLALITTSGRLADAFYDPFIGQLSDRSTAKRGRRIPFMQWSFLPAVVFCILVFCPPDHEPTAKNAWWLAIMLALFFISATSFIIPCNALLPELAHTPEDRVRLATLQQTGFVVGIVISSATNNLADGIQQLLSLQDEREAAVQVSIAILCAIAAVFMLVPVLVIDERKYCHGKPSHLPLLKAVKATLRNRNFLLYAAADFSWYMALYIITSGLLFYVTVLAGEQESLGVVLMGTMVAVSLVFYPMMNGLSKRFGKKKIVMLAFLVLALVCSGVFLIGHLPFSAKLQLFLFVGFAAFPLAALGILPPAILADIAEEDAAKTGENREGLFFAVKYFVVKLGQTLGIAVFSILTLWGKDPGHDFGLRLSGIVVAVLCVVAAMVFSFFRESPE